METSRRWRRREVLALAVKVASDHHRFPKTWLFSHRWDGSCGATELTGKGRHAIVRGTIGGRTTAWVPSPER